jgi:Asp-tRNA(Asn)/Glu-tRNA(Gln) amidotransferase A subunit family amidase
MPIDVTHLDATAQAELVIKGDVTAAELVDGAIERIERLNPNLNAVITPLFEKARAESRAKLAPGPFRGVPFLMKDLIATTAGDPIHNGMQLLKTLGFVAPEDSYLARKFREAGFINLGKTNTPELGLAATTEPLAYGPTRNPWNTEHSAGGSSGGDDLEIPIPALQRIAARTPFTPAFNATGQPAMSLPLHWSADGLPVGVHFVAPYAREDVLIRIAAQLEAAQPWANRRPPVSA